MAFSISKKTRPENQGAARASGSGQRALPQFVADAASHVEMPAYVALAAAVGASLWALCHVVDDSSFSFQIWLAMLLGLVYSFATRAASRYATTKASGFANATATKATATKATATKATATKATAKSGEGKEAKRGERSSRGSAGWLVAFALVVLPPVMASAGASLLVPVDLLSDSNLTLIVFIGWMMVASLFVVGAPYRASSGLRPVPFSAAIVPALSLFGLLNVYSVDSIISVCFLLFVAATLYLAAYETMLRHAQSGGQKGAQNDDARFEGAHEYSYGGAAAETAAMGSGAARRVWATAGQYLLACGAWFGIFAGGAALFYYPLLAVLPSSLQVGFAGGNSSSAGALPTDDWRSPGRTMELRGGPYPLSNTPAMSVAGASKQSDTLWRGRVYEKYVHLDGQGSHWEIDASDDQIKRVATLSGAWSTIKALDPTFEPPGPRREVSEIIRPLAMRSRAIFAQGQPFRVRGTFEDLFSLPDGTLRFQSARRNSGYYSVRSRVLSLSPADLLKAPALNAAQLRKWKSGAVPRLAGLLELRGESGAQIREIAAEIIAARKLARNATPALKAQAIADYLHETCEYSLNPPAIPAGQDAVINFLTGSKMGACDMFASSMVLLLRAMDVPARVASGYRFPSDPNDSRGQMITVRDRDAHAWVEYYVPRFGWVKHDPSDGTREAPAALTAQIGQLLHWDQITNQARLLVMPVLGLMLLLLGGAWTLADKRAALPKARPSDDEIARSHITRAYHDAARLLSRRLPARRAPDEAADARVLRTDGARLSSTARELEEAVLRSTFPVEVKTEFAALTYLFTQAHYGAWPAAQVEEKALRASLQRLKQAAKQKV